MKATRNNNDRKPFMLTGLIAGVMGLSLIMPSSVLAQRGRDQQDNRDNYRGNVSLVELSVNDTRYRGEQTGAALVTISRPAPSGGLEVGISSDDQNLVTTPRSVMVPGGKTATSFNFTVHGSARNDSVRLYAKAGGETKSVDLKLGGFGITELRVSPSNSGSSSFTGTIYFSGKVQSEQIVYLSSSDPSIAEVPATIRVRGGAASQSFPINIRNASRAKEITIYAKYEGMMETASVPINRVDSGWNNDRNNNWNDNRNDDRNRRRR